MKKAKKEGIKWKVENEERLHLSQEGIIAVLIVTVALAVVSLIFANVFYAVFLLLAGITYVVLPKRLAKKFDFFLNEDGLESTNRFYPLSSIDRFNIVDVPGELAHLILFVGGLEQRLVIPVFDKDVSDIEEYFKEKNIIKDDQLQISWIEKLAKKI